MLFISATRLRLRSIWFLLPFLKINQSTIRQLKESTGFIQGKLLIDRKFTFWTLTAWASEKDMKAYRNGGAQLKAMPKLINWCDEATAVHWTTESTGLPDWNEVAQHIAAPEARVSKLYHPTQNHTAKTFPAPRYPSKLEQILEPKKNIV